MLDLLENSFALSAPTIGLGLEIALGQVRFDVPDQLTDAGEAAFANYVLSEFAEEALDEVEPGASGWRAMNVKSRTPCEPRFHFLVFVYAVVVHNEMNIQILGRLSVDFGFWTRSSMDSAISFSIALLT